MREAGFFRMMPLALICLVLTCCSGSKDAEQGKASNRTATEQTVEAVKEFGKKPIDKARAAQQMGEDRTKAMDEAVKGQ
jgi:hypothetical protein